MLSRRFRAIGSTVVDDFDDDNLKVTSYRAVSEVGAKLLAALFNAASREDCIRYE